MDMKPLHQHIYDLLDFSDSLQALMQESPDERDNFNYLTTLIYIEDVLDKYGRGFAHVENNHRGSEEVDTREFNSRVTSRMDELRRFIRTYIDANPAVKDEIKRRMSHVASDWAGFEQ